MTKKEKAIQKIEESLEFWGVECRNKRGVAIDIVEAILELIEKPKRTDQTPGSKVWDAYEQTFEQVHKYKPPRNMKTNSLCKELVKRLGEEAAIAVAAFFVNQHDKFYEQTKHDLALCVRDCHELYGRWKTGKWTTDKTARKIESAAATMSAGQSYLAKKYGHSGGETRE